MDYLKYKENFKDEWYILGIDFGDTNVVVSYYNNKTKKVETLDLSMGFGKIPIPFVIQLRENEKGDEWIFGEEANRSSAIYEENTVKYLLKKLKDDEKIKLGEEFYSAKELVSKYLQSIFDNLLKMSPKAEIKGITIAISNTFLQNDIKEILECFELIGYKDKVINVIYEDEAVFNSYLNYNDSYSGNTLLIDFGGNNCTTSVFEVNNEEIKLVSQRRLENFGGEKIDSILLNQFYKYIEENGINTESLTSANISELKIKATEIKERLSSVESVRIPFTFCVPPFMKQLNILEFETILEDMGVSLKKQIESVLNESKIQSSNINKILLTGGSSNLPLVKKVLTQIFNDESKIELSKTADTEIAMGACISGLIKCGFNEYKSVKLIDDDSKNDIEFLQDIYLKDNETLFKMISKGSSPHFAISSTVLNKAKDNKKIAIITKNENEEKVICDIDFSNVSDEKYKITLTLLDNGSKLKVLLQNNSEYENKFYLNVFDYNTITL